MYFAYYSYGDNMPKDNHVDKASDVEFIEALAASNKGTGAGVGKALLLGAAARGVITGVNKKSKKQS